MCVNVSLLYSMIFPHIFISGINSMHFLCLKHNLFFLFVFVFLTLNTMSCTLGVLKVLFFFQYTKIALSVFHGVIKMFLLKMFFIIFIFFNELRLL